MNIGVDIDGVLADYFAYVRDVVRPHFSSFDETEYRVHEMFGLDKGVSDKFWESEIWNYTQNVLPMKDASEFMHRLIQDGHKIVINTARWLSCRDDDVGSRKRDMVREWLGKYNIPYDEIAFANFERGKIAMSKNPYDQKGKSRVVKEFSLDLHIDDAPHEVELLSSTIPIIIFDNPYNRECNPPNTHRAKNWAEVYQIINKLRS